MEGWHEDVIVWGRNVGRVGDEAGCRHIFTPFEEAAVMHLQQACKVKEWEHAVSIASRVWVTCWMSNLLCSPNQPVVHAHYFDADSTAFSAETFCIWHCNMASWKYMQSALLCPRCSISGCNGSAKVELPDTVETKACLLLCSWQGLLLWD